MGRKKKGSAGEKAVGVLGGENKLEKVLTIAGSDSGGGAGIQSDLKTFSALKVYGTCAITSLTAQNTLGVRGIHMVPPPFVLEQMEAVLSDIDIRAAKTGMLGTADIVRTVSSCLRQYRLPFLVVDPVMVAESGDRLLQEDAVEVLKRELIPLASVVTPNLKEAEVLSGMNVRTEDDMCRAAVEIARLGSDYVLVKGGHLPGKALDILFDGQNFQKIVSEKIDTPHTHGTGCTLSSAITAFLARGYNMADASLEAKKYVTSALKAAFQVGRGRGPLHHMFSFYN